MNEVKLEQRDGTYAQMRHTDIEIDPTDPRSRGKRRRMYYKFLLNVSSTDIQVSILTFHTRGRMKHLIVAKEEISMADKGEFESAGLQEEYNNIVAGREAHEDSAEDSDEDRHSQHHSEVSVEAVRRLEPHREREHSPTRLKRRFEASSSSNIKEPPVYAPQLQGMALAARNMLSRDPKRVALSEFMHSPHSSIIHQKTPQERGRDAAPQTLEPASKANSRYRTRSSTPMRSSDQLHQSRDRSAVRESQVCIPALIV
jgi:hypothetical protein